MTVHKEGRREKKQRENMIANRGRREGGREREGFGGERDRGEEGERKRETGETHTHTHTPNFGFPVWMARIEYSKPPDLLRGMSL